MVQVGNLMLGVFFVFLAMVLGLYNSSLQADYDQYCTGLVGFFVELGSEGKCSDLKSMITMTSAVAAVSGFGGADASITPEQLAYEQQLMAAGYPADYARAYADQHFRPWLKQ